MNEEKDRYKLVGPNRGNRPAIFCNDCGVLVLRTPIHTKWHDEIDKLREEMMDDK